MTRTALVTGANKGIGFGLVKQLAADSSFSLIFATTRAPEKAIELEKFAASSNGRVHVVRLEINQSSISKAVQDVESKLGGKGLDILINNIGACDMTENDFITTQHLRDNFENNVVSTQVVTDAFLPLLKKGNEKKILVISSAAASLTIAPGILHHASGAVKMGWGPYAISKAALNMLTALYASQLGAQGFIIIPVHPGLVNTDLLRGDERFAKDAISVEESASKVLPLINKATTADNGKFFSYDGTILPW